MKFNLFTKTQRQGLIALVILILALQAYLLFSGQAPDTYPPPFEDAIAERLIDSMKKAAQSKSKEPSMTPFNPNFITDYKGYVLGMSLEEIDRLQAYRGKGLFVNSAEEFQAVTGVSDSLLQRISTFFKFPEWTKQKPSPASKGTPPPIVKADLNAATASDLEKVNGIGKVLSERIISLRSRIGGFVIPEQLYRVYGLKPEIAKKVFERFSIKNPPSIDKVSVNSGSVKALSGVYFISYSQAMELVAYRTQHGDFKDFAQVAKILKTDSLQRASLPLYLKL